MFRRIRDDLEQTFATLPAPTPAPRNVENFARFSRGQFLSIFSIIIHQSISLNNYPCAGTTSMATVLCQSAPCFAGFCRVEMQNGKLY
jgi:hypothetical protein